MTEGDLVIYTDSWGIERQALFIRHVSETTVEIVRLDGLRLQCATSYIKKGAVNESR